MYNPIGSSIWTAKNAAIAAVITIAVLAGVAIDRLLLAPLPAVIPAEETVSDELKIDPDRIRAAGIEFAKVQPGDADSQVIAQATVMATPEGAAVIGARADGTVTRISKRLGDPVAKGEILGAIQSREAARLAEDRAGAQARVTRAEQAFTRQRNLMDANATSRQDFDAAQAEWRIAQAEVGRAGLAASASGLSGDGVSLNIVSPVAGRVTAASAVLGAYVVAGTELFRVADPTKLEVQASVPTADAHRVAVGNAAIILTGQGEVPAIVRAITPDVNMQSRAATVVLLPKGNSSALQPGQYVSARILVAHGHSDRASVLVPTEAVQRIEGGDAVFVRTPTGFRVRQVVIGAENGGQTEVRAGLRTGDEIATTNAFLLKAELLKGTAGDND